MAFSDKTVAHFAAKEFIEKKRILM